MLTLTLTCLSMFQQIYLFILFHTFPLVSRKSFKNDL